MDVADMLERADALLAAGRPGAARPLLAAVRSLRGDSGGDQDDGVADALETRLLLREGRHAAARALLDTAVERRPRDPQLRRTRAELLLVLGETVAAATDAAESVVLAPRDPAGKAVLGVVMGALGQWRDSEACLREAISGDPGCIAYRLALARVQQRAGDATAAQATLTAAIEREPRNATARAALVALVASAGEFARAVALSEAARAAGAVDACLLGVHGHALSCLGRHDEAAGAYQDALAMAPEDPYVRHLVAASGRVAPGPRAPEAYVRVLFDGYAHRFDRHLASLDYRVPQLLRAAVLRHAPDFDAAPRRGPVLDLGCGTGLAAVAMAGLPWGPWHGVDLSSAMLARAAATGRYERLVEADLMTALAEPGPRYKLIVLSDVLCYFGDLEPVLRAARNRVAADDGLLALSLETLAPRAAGPGWRLGPLGRYAHAPATLAAAAAASGLVVRDLDHETLRQEGDAPVPGLIAVLSPAPA